MKYKLKASVITPLTDAGVIDGNGDITLNIPHREQGQAEKMFMVTWKAATEALQTSNPRAMRAIRNTTAPPRKVNGAWRILDPTIKWFDELDDSDATPGKGVDDTDGDQVLSRFERKLIKKYKDESGVDVTRPHPKDLKTNHNASLAAAKAHFGIS